MSFCCSVGSLGCWVFSIDKCFLFSSPSFLPSLLAPSDLHSAPLLVRLMVCFSISMNKLVLTPLSHFQVVSMCFGRFCCAGVRLHVGRCALLPISMPCLFHLHWCPFSTQLRQPTLHWLSYISFPALRALFWLFGVPVCSCFGTVLAVV